MTVQAKFDTTCPRMALKTKIFKDFQFSSSNDMAITAFCLTKFFEEILQLAMRGKVSVAFHKHWQATSKEDVRKTKS